MESTHALLRCQRHHARCSSARTQLCLRVQPLLRDRCRAMCTCTRWRCDAIFAKRTACMYAQHVRTLQAQSRRHSVSCSVTVIVACVHKCSIGGATQSASDPRGSLQPGCARRVGDASQVAGRPPSACAHITSLQMLMHHALRCGSRHCNMRASQVQAICPARVAVRGAVRAGRL